MNIDAQKKIISRLKEVNKLSRVEKTVPVAITRF